MPPSFEQRPQVRFNLIACYSYHVLSDRALSILRSSCPLTLSTGITVIDVRDSDYVGGHIVGCLHVPTQTLDYRMPELVRTLRDQDTVVFHCSLSQQRGPGSALRYLRERAAMANGGKVGERQDGRTVEEAQKVVVLDGGFSKWQQA